LVPNCDPEDRTTVSKYLSYTYMEKNGKPKTIRLPPVHIYLKSRTIDTETVALLDTGATKTILLKEYADILALGYIKDDHGTSLNLKLSEQEELSTVGGSPAR
jgi:hypothetical protein